MSDPGEVQYGQINWSPDFKSESPRAEAWQQADLLYNLVPLAFASPCHHVPVEQTDGMQVRCPTCKKRFAITWSSECHGHDERLVTIRLVAVKKSEKSVDIPEEPGSI